MTPWCCCQRPTRWPRSAAWSPPPCRSARPQTTLVVNGESFVPGSVVRVNGVARTTNFVSANQLEATLPASDFTSAGTRTITVFNPTPGGGVSNNSLPLVVQAANQNPKPSVQYLNPQGAEAGDAAFTLSIFGSNFVQGATVQWNGANRATTFVNSGEVRISTLTPALSLLGRGSQIPSPSQGEG
jgi:hypothetical protein